MPTDLATELRRVADGLQRNPPGYADDAAALMRRAAAVVERLPVTADGVAAYPGMTVYVRRYADEDTPVEEDRLIIEPAEYNSYDLSACYSTREAALAAKDGGDVQCPVCKAWGWAIDEFLNPHGPGCVKCKEPRRSFVDTHTATLRFEVAQAKDALDEWIVEAIDNEGEGEIYAARFGGPEARERAEEYARWKNSGAGWHSSTGAPPVVCGQP